MIRRSGLSLLAIFAVTLPACNSEILQKQAEQIKQQELEIAQQRKDLEAMLAGQKLQDQKQQDCNRAFRDYFEKAQMATSGDEAIALYREGLSLCPEDEVAHYELGRALADRGRYLEAEKELETALSLRPDFTDARRQLESIRKNR
jgi:tetratricopeptide (TPR) repeat protein